MSMDKLLSSVTKGNHRKRSIVLKEASARYLGVTPKSAVKRMRKIVR